MLLPYATDYTDKDFDSLRLRLQNLIQSVFPEWTDFNVANFGNILMELFAHVGDVLTFYQDNQARQSRISTVTSRKALLGLVKLLGYKAPTATASRATVVISLPESPVGDVVFPVGTVVTTDEVTEPIEYRTLSEVTIVGGASPPEVSVVAEHSEPREDLFSSSNTANQSFTLSRTPFIDGTAAVVAGLDEFVEVDNFLSSRPSDKHFTVAVDQNDRATVRFGNGVNGQVPSGTITVTYKTGGGSAGRVDAGKLKRVVGSFRDSLGNAAAPTATNPSASSGGTDRATVAQVKARAPASIRAPTNCVAREDFEIHAVEVPGVARALMLTRNEDPGIAENTGVLYPIPEGGGAPSQLLKDAVKTQVTVTFPCTLTFTVYVQDPAYKAVDVYALVYLRQGAKASVVRAAIMSALTTFFAVTNSDGTPNPAVDFGANVRDVDGNVVAEVALSDVFDLVKDVPGVRKVGANAVDFLLNGERADVTLLPREFPTLGAVTLVNGDTGADL